MEECAEAMVDAFGTDADAPLALLLGIDNGHSLQQIVDAVFAGRFTADGVVRNAIGLPTTPAQSPLGLIIRDTSVPWVPRSEFSGSLRQALDRLQIAVIKGATDCTMEQVAGLTVLAIAAVFEEQLPDYKGDLGALIGAIVEEPFTIEGTFISFFDGEGEAIEGDSACNQNQACVFRPPTDAKSSLDCANIVNANLLCDRELSVVVLYGFPNATVIDSQLCEDCAPITFWNGSALFVGQVSGLGGQTENIFLAGGGYGPGNKEGQCSVLFNDDATAIERISIDFTYTEPGLYDHTALEGSGILPLVADTRPRPDDIQTWASTYKLTGAAACDFIDSVDASRRSYSRETTLDGYRCTEHDLVEIRISVD